MEDPFRAAENDNHAGDLANRLRLHQAHRMQQRDARPAGDLPLFNETDRRAQDLFQIPPGES